MSDTSAQGGITGLAESLAITYMDGSTDTASRLGRPGLLIRLERAYPELNVTREENAAHLRVEHLFYLAWTALRIDRPDGDPLRPGDDLLAWADTVAEIEEVEQAPDPPVALEEVPPLPAVEAR